MTRLRFTRSVHAVLVAGALALGIGCSSEGPSSTPASAPPAKPAAPVHDGRAIEITGDDKMKFNVTEITAKPGEKLSVTLVNIGTTPKLSMGHNFILLAPGTDLTQFAVAAAEAAVTDYVPKNSDRVLAASKLLGPGERDTVTFNAPSTPGRYEFVCSFPGHLQVGMRGVLIVG